MVSPQVSSMTFEHPLRLYSPVRVALFRLYLRFLFWRRFSAVRLAHGARPADFAGRPLVAYCNHPSWWDPALLLLTLPRLLQRRGFGPMDSAELERYGLFRRMGMFPVEPGSRRSAAAFLRIAQEGLAEPGSCLCITAEGAFTDPRVRPVRLRAGLAHLARRMPEAVFLPVALEYGFWNESKPEALLRFGTPVRPVGEASVADWQQALEAGLVETMDALAAASAARDPAAFSLVFSGTAGVGGIYDGWRRARAMATGRPFMARHGGK